MRMLFDFASFSIQGSQGFRGFGFHSPQLLFSPASLFDFSEFRD
jgi:hypothetical protein